MNGNAVGLERRRIWIVFEFSLICQFLFAILGGRKRLADFSENFEVEERHMNNTYISIQVYGLEFFMEQKKIKYTCPKCGGIISVHDRECSECQEKMK